MSCDCLIKLDTMLDPKYVSDTWTPMQLFDYIHACVKAARRFNHEETMPSGTFGKDMILASSGEIRRLRDIEAAAKNFCATRTTTAFDSPAMWAAANSLTFAVSASKVSP